MIKLNRTKKIGHGARGQLEDILELGVVQTDQDSGGCLGWGIGVIQRVQGVRLLNDHSLLFDKQLFCFFLKTLTLGIGLSD